MISGTIRAGRAFVELFVDNNPLTRGLKQAEQKINDFGRRIHDLGRRLMFLGLSASVPFAASIKTFAAFDDNMRAVAATLQANEKEFERLCTTAKNLGRTTTFTANQVSYAMLELGRAGFDTDMIDHSIASILDLSRATGANLTDSTRIAINTLYAFGMSAGEMTRICDALVTGVNSSSMNVVDLGYGLKYCSTIASEFGLTLEETVKMIGALSNVGIKGSMAGTSFRRILTNLTDPRIQKKVEALGVAVRAPSGEMRNISEILKDIGHATDRLPSGDKLSLFKEIFSLWALPGAAKLTGADFEILNNALDNAMGRARQTAQGMDAGIGGSFRRLWAVLEGLAIALGETLAPAIKEITDIFVPAINGVTRYIEANRGLVLQTAKIIVGVIAVGGALMAFGTTLTGLSMILLVVAGTVSMVTSSLMLLLKPLFITASVLLTCGKVFVSVFGVLANVISTTALIGSVVLSRLAGVIFAVFGGIGRVILVSAYAGVLALRMLGTAAIAIIAAFRPLVGYIATAFTALAPYIVAACNALGTAILGILGTVWSALATGLSVIPGNVFRVLALAGTQITTALATTGNAIVVVFAGIGKGIMAALIWGVKSAMTAMATVLAPVFAPILRAAVLGFSQILAIVVRIFSLAGAQIAVVLARIGTGLLSTFTAIGTGVKAALAIAGQSITSAFALIGKGIVAALAPVGKGVMAIFAGLRSVLVPVGKLIVTAFTAVGKGIVAALAPVGKAIVTAFVAVGKFIPVVFAAVGKTMMTVLATVGKTVLSAMTAILMPVLTTIGAVLQGALSFLAVAATKIFGVMVAVVAKGILMAGTVLVAFLAKTLVVCGPIIAAIAAIGIAFGALLWGLRALNQALGLINANFETMLGETATAFLSLANTIWGFLKGLVSGIASVGQTLWSALGWIGAAIVSLFASAISKAWNAVSSFLAWLGPAFKAIAGWCLAPIREVCRGIGIMVSAAFGSLWSIVGSFLSWFGTAFVGAFQWVITAIGNMVQQVAPVVASAVSSVLSAIGSVVASFASAFMTVASWIVTPLINEFKNLGGHITGIFQKCWSLAKPFLSWIGEAFAGAFKRAIGLLGGLFSGIASLTASAMGTIRSAIGSLPGALASIFVSLARALGSALMAIANGCVSAVIGTFKMLGSAIAGIFGYLWSVIRPFVQWIGEAFTWVVSAIGGLASQVGSIITSAVGSAMSAITNVLSNMWSGLSGLFVNLFEGISEIIVSFTNFFMDAFGKIGDAVDWLRDQFGELSRYAVTAYEAIVAAFRKGDIEAAVAVIWTTIKLVWVTGTNFLLNLWYWLSDTVQDVWFDCVYKVAGIFVNALSGIDSAWAEVVYSLRLLWFMFINSVMEGWDAAAKAGAKAWAYVKSLAGGDSYEVRAAQIDDDYNQRGKQRQADYEAKMSGEFRQNEEAKKRRHSDQTGILGVLEEMKRTGQEQRDQSRSGRAEWMRQREAEARAGFELAIAHAIKPPEEPKAEPLVETLRKKLEGITAGLQMPQNFTGEKLSVAGTFHGGMAGQMAGGGSLDRIAKATEKSEQHLARLAKKEGTPKIDTKKQEPKPRQPEANDKEVRLVKAAEESVKIQRDILRNSMKFA